MNKAVKYGENFIQHYKRQPYWKAWDKPKCFLVTFTSCICHETSHFDVMTSLKS